MKLKDIEKHLFVGDGDEFCTNTYIMDEPKEGDLMFSEVPKDKIIFFAEDLKKFIIKKIENIYKNDWVWDYIIDLKTNKSKKYKLYQKKEFNEVANALKKLFYIKRNDLK